MRPVSITIVAWALMLVSMLGFGGLALATAHLADPTMVIFAQDCPVPVVAVLVWAGLGLFVLFLSGKFMLAGANWSRMLYTAWVVVNVLLSLFLAPTQPVLMIGNILAASALLFLFLPNANRHFRRRRR